MATTSFTAEAVYFAYPSDAGSWILEHAIEDVASQGCTAGEAWNQVKFEASTCTPEDANLLFARRFESACDGGVGFMDIYAVLHEGNRAALDAYRVFSNIRGEVTVVCVETQYINGRQHRTSHIKKTFEVEL